jgi:hypothetical protein
MVFAKLRELRERVHGLTQRDVFVHNERDERLQREALHAMIDAEESQLRIDLAALTDAPSTLDGGADAASHIDPSDAAVLACFTPSAGCLYAFGDERASIVPPPAHTTASTVPFFDERYFSSARMTDEHRRRIDATLARFVGRDIDYHNFTKLDPREKAIARITATNECEGESKAACNQASNANSTAPLSVSATAEDDDDPRQAGATQRTVYRCAITEVFVRNGVVSDEILIENVRSRLYFAAAMTRIDACTYTRARPTVCCYLLLP